jgi:hypothetical protein
MGGMQTKGTSTVIWLPPAALCWAAWQYQPSAPWRGESLTAALQWISVSGEDGFR